MSLVDSSSEHERESCDQADTEDDDDTELGVCPCGGAGVPVAEAHDAVGLVLLHNDDLALGGAQLVLCPTDVRAQLAGVQILDADRGLGEVVSRGETGVDGVILEEIKTKNSFHFYSYMFIA